MNTLSLVNTRSQLPATASDFDVKSPALARARESAAAREARNLEEDYMQGIVNAQFESSVAHENYSNAEFENHRESVAPGQSSQDVVTHSLNRADDLEIDEIEIDDLEIDEIADSHSATQDGSREEGDEDYAEFERVFIEWKATGDPRLRERLILMNRSMVMFLARRFMDRGELFEDVLQVGMLGLIYALDGYNLERGVKFSTFAIPTISGEIRRYFRDKVSGMRVPRGLQELHATLQTRIEELTQQLDRSPTYAEIAFSLKIEVEQVVEAMELGSAIDPLSIDDRFYGEESATIAESIGAPDPQLHAYEEHATLQAALEKLPEQERRVLEMNYFDGHSQAEIARRLNVSQMHISRLLRRSLAQLKELLEDS